MFDIAHLALWSKYRAPRNRAAISSAALSLVGSIVLLVLSAIEHMRSIRPSWLLNMYLLLTVVFDVARSRTYSLSPELDAVATVFTSRVAVKLILAIVEARPKRRLLLPQFADCPPEAISGPYKRALFWWLNALFKKGYTESLTVDDLFQLDKHLQSDYLHHLLGSSWDRRKLSYGCRHMLCTSTDCTTFSSDTHRPALSLRNHVTEAQVACLGRATSASLSHRFQLLPTVFDQSGRHILPAARHDSDDEYWLWADWRIRSGLRWNRSTSALALPKTLGLVVLFANEPNRYPRANISTRRSGSLP
jgi:hypothetical protein